MQRGLPKVVLVAAAAGAVALLGLIALTAQMRPSDMLQTPASKMEAFLPEAERQLHMLEQQMPVGHVASEFPREEHELKDLFSRTDKGLHKIDRKVMAENEEQKKAHTESLYMVPQRARKQKAVGKRDLAALVNKAGQTMYMLEHQLPAADRAMFPKEARELQSAFSSELSKLSKIREQMQGEGKKKARYMTPMLSSKKGAMPEVMAVKSSMKQLDKEKAADDKENHKIASAADVDDFLSAINSAATKSTPATMLARAESEYSSDESVTDKRGDDMKVALPTWSAKQTQDPFKMKHKEHTAKPKTGRRRTSLTGPRSSIPVWGTVLDPTLSWHKGGPIMPALTSGGQRDYLHYAKEANAAMDVFDPVVDNHKQGPEDWVKKDPTGKAQWWVHNHYGRGY